MIAVTVLSVSYGFCICVEKARAVFAGTKKTAPDNGQNDSAMAKMILSIIVPVPGNVFWRCQGTEGFQVDLCVF